MDALDFRLLVVFDAIYRLRSVTAAARALAMGQATVSVTLAKLRRLFGDPLFVRTGARMEPTPFAEGLARPVEAALAAIEAVIRHRSDFTPATSERIFRICMTDISQLVLLPRLWERMRLQAPGIRIEVLPLSSATARMLQSGESDLALGFMPQLDAGFFQQLLFNQDFVCLVGQNHPRLRSHLSVEDYEAEEHAIVSSSGAAPLILEREIARQNIRRKIVLEIPSFLGAAFVAERTDLIVTIPRRLGGMLTIQGAFRLFPVPFPVPQYSVKLHWHERYHHDEGNKWLRALIFDLLFERIRT